MKKQWYARLYWFTALCFFVAAVLGQNATSAVLGICFAIFAMTSPSEKTKQKTQQKVQP